MDPLTRKIITILRRDGRASYSDIARALDTNRDSVAGRVNPLFQSGALRVIAAPNPRVLGLTVSAHLSIHVSGETRDVIKALEQLKSLVLISVTVGGFQIITETDVHDMSELAQQISLIRNFPGVIDVQTLLYDRVLHSFFLGGVPKSAAYDFDEFDRKIIECLQQDGRASYGALAEHVGLSLSGCRIRIQRMLESEVIQIGAIPQRSEMNDLLFGVGLTVKSDTNEAVKLLQAVPELEFLATTVGRFDLVATLGVNSLNDLNELMARLLALPSITYCEQWLHRKLVRERYEHMLDHLTAPNT